MVGGGDVTGSPSPSPAPHPPRARSSPVPKWPPRHRIPPFSSTFCSLCLLRRVWTRSPRRLFFQETHSVLSHGRPGTSHSPCPARVQIITQADADTQRLTKARGRLTHNEQGPRVGAGWPCCRRRRRPHSRHRSIILCL